MIIGLIFSIIEIIINLEIKNKRRNFGRTKKLIKSREEVLEEVRKILETEEYDYMLVASPKGERNPSISSRCSAEDGLSMAAIAFGYYKGMHKKHLEDLLSKSFDDA